MTSVHDWLMADDLAALPGTPAVNTIRRRAEDRHRQWAHYERAKPEDVECNASPQAHWVYRLAPGATWEPYGGVEPDTEPDRPVPMPVYVPSGAWCLWDEERQLPRLLGRPWREHLAELSELVGLQGAADMILEAIEDEGRWVRLLHQVEEREGELAAQALRRLTARATPSASERAIREDLAKMLRPPLERWEEEEEAKRMATIKAARRRAEAEEEPVERPVENVEEVEEVEEEEIMAEEEITPYVWTSAAKLATCDGAPTSKTIMARARYGDEQWAHYEEAEVAELEGDWHPNMTYAYRLAEGTSWEPLEIAPELTPEQERWRRVAQHADERLADAAREHKAEVAELRAEIAALEDQATAWKAERDQARDDLSEMRRREQRLSRQATTWRDERDKARADVQTARDDYEALRQMSVAQKTEIAQLSYELRRRDQEDDARRLLGVHAEEARRRMVAAEALLREMVEGLEPGDDAGAWRAVFLAARYLLELERSE